MIILNKINFFFHALAKFFNLKFNVPVFNLFIKLLNFIILVLGLTINCYFINFLNFFLFFIRDHLSLIIDFNFLRTLG